MDKIIEELVRETRYEIVETLLKMKKLTKEEIARAAEITVKEVEELEKELNLQKMERGMWREGRILDILLSRKKRSSFLVSGGQVKEKDGDVLEKGFGINENERSK